MLREEDRDLKIFHRRLVVFITVSTLLLYVGVWHFARNAHLESA